MNATTVEIIRAVAELLKAIAWPVVALGAGVVFRREIVDLSKRLRKGGGAEFDPAPQLASTSGNAAGASATASAALTQFPGSPATLRWEQMIRSSEPLSGVSDPQQREALLLRLFARAILVLIFEQADANIYASQLGLLTYLNNRRQGESLGQLKTLFYDPAAERYPDWYAKYGFQDYLGYLTRFNLLLVSDSTATITQEGIEYLAWRVEQARPPRLAG